MMKNNISNIIKRYLSSRFSPKTEEKVQRWLIIKTNEQLTYNFNTSTSHVEEILSNEADEWLNEESFFANSTLDEILKTLERRFNVPISNRTTTSTTNLYTIKFLRNESLEDILIILGETVGFKYRKEREQIIINNAD